MKTIEEKARAYDEALEKARQLCAYPTTKSFISDLQDLFPELAESEDKKILVIIKHCIESRYLYTSTIKGISQKQCLAWLEKQGEKDILEDAILDGNEDGLIAETIRYKNEKHGEQKPVWSEEDECYMTECINAIATKDSWSFEEKRKTKHWVKLLKQRIGG